MSDEEERGRSAGRAAARSRSPSRTRSPPPERSDAVKDRFDQTRHIKCLRDRFEQGRLRRSHAKQEVFQRFRDKFMLGGEYGKAFYEASSLNTSETVELKGKEYNKLTWDMPDMWESQLLTDLEYVYGKGNVHVKRADKRVGLESGDVMIPTLKVTVTWADTHEK